MSVCFSLSSTYPSAGHVPDFVAMVYVFRKSFHWSLIWVSERSEVGACV